MDFQHVTTWIFDLDNTLYPPRMRLFDQIQNRMTGYVMRELGLDQAQANQLRRDYWRAHGTTLSGLMATHDIDPLPFLREVHDIDMSHLLPDLDLAAQISALPGRKIVHTNGDTEYAARVLAARGLGMFDEVHGINTTGFHPKPSPLAYAAVMTASGFDPKTAAMFEDDPRNLTVPHDLGMRTILVGPDIPDEDAPTDGDGPHVQHRTTDLTAFLRALAVPRVRQQN